MATDNLGRQQESITAADLAAAFLAATKQPDTGKADVVDKLLELIKKQSAETKKLADLMAGVVQGDANLAKKLESLRKSMGDNIKAAVDLNQKFKEANKKKSGGKAGVTNAGLKKALESVETSEEVKQLYKMLTQGHNNKGIRKPINSIVKELGELKDAISVQAREAKRRKARRAVLGDIPISEEAVAGPRRGKRGNPASVIGDMPGMGQPVAGIKDLDKLSATQRVAAMYTDKIFKNSRYTAQVFGESLVDHKLFLEQLKAQKAFGDEEAGFDVKRIEAQQKHTKYATNYSEAQQHRLKMLKDEVRLSQGNDIRQRAAIDSYFKYIQKVNRQLEIRHHLESMIHEIDQKLVRGIEKTANFFTGVNVIDRMTKGVIEDQRKYIHEIRLTALQQGQVTHQLEEQEAFSEARVRTGKSLSELQQHYVKMQRSGIKDSRIANKLAERSLHLSSQIGANADGTSEMLRSWHLEFGIATVDVGRLTNEMRMAGKMTGVLGDELVKAVKSTEQAMNNMRSIGTLTAEATAQFIKLSTAAQKFGISKEMADLQDFLTGGIGKFGGAHTGIRQLAFEAARIKGINQERVMFGTMNEQETTDLMKGVSEIFEDMMASVGAAGQKVTDLTREQIQALQPAMMRFGMGIGDLERLQKAINEANKTYLDRLADLQAKKAMTDDKYLTGLERANREIEFSELKFNESLKLLSKKNLTQEDSKTLKAMGISGPDTDKQLIKAIQASLEEQRKIITEAGGRDLGMPNAADFKRALTGDAEAVEKFKEIALTQSAKFATELQRLQSPVEQTNALLQGIHDMLQSTIGNWIVKISSYVAPIAIIATGIASMASAMGIALKTWLAIKPWLGASKEAAVKSRDYLQGLFNRAAHKGSLFTHDIHTVRAIEGVRQAILQSGGLGGGMGGGLGGRKGRHARGSHAGGAKGTRTRRAGRRGRGRFGRLAGAGLAGLEVASLMGMDSPLMDIVDVGATGADIVGDVNAVRGLASASKGGVAAAGAGGFLSKLGGVGKFAGGAGKLAGRALPFLGNAIGALTGLMEAPSTGRGRFEGATLGLLTGGADTGSMVGSLLGMQGTATDEALGVLGAGAGGALTGAAIGSVIPVVGTAIGAVIGGAIGTGAELYKVFTKPDSPLRKKLSGWGEALWDGTKQAGSWLWSGAKTLGKWSMLPYKTAFKVAKTVGSALWTKTKEIGHWLWGGAKELANAEAVDTKKLHRAVNETKGTSGFAKALDWVNGIFDGAVSIAKSIGSKLWDGIKSIADFVLAPFNWLWQKVTGGGKANVGNSPPNIPALANGGIVTKPTLAVVGEAGPEAVMPLSGKSISSPMMPGKVGMNDLAQKIKEERLASAPPAVLAAVADDMGDVEENTKNTVDQLKALVLHMQTLISIFQQGGQGATGGFSTRGRSAPVVPPNYHSWQRGLYTSNASKGPVLNEVL